MPVPENAVRLVPKDPDPYDETVAMIERLGWTPSADSGDDLAEWDVPGSDTVVRWVEDGDTGAHYFIVEGPDRQRVADDIRSSIDLLDVADFGPYLAKFHGSQGLMRGLYTVAAAAPARPDPRVTDLFRHYLTDDDPLIRRVALLAAGITGWPDFVQPATRIRDNDPDPEVREAATAALQSLPS
jgi:hypothetical protein